MKASAKNAAFPARLAVKDITTALKPGQYRMTIAPNREWVRHQIVAWSVGLKWLTFEFYNTVHNASSPVFQQGRDEEYLDTEEQPSMEKWMLPYHQCHMVTHEAALLHGLTPGGGNDLPVERIMVDRLLKEMVCREGIDLHGPAQELASDDDYLQLLAYNLEYMGTFVGDRYIQLRQVGLSLPVLSTWMPMGDASYCGNALDLDNELPETICLGVIGRRLGDLVATGSSELDARVITEVVASRWDVTEHWPTSTKTRLYLEPDLVELGSRVLA